MRGLTRGLGHTSPGLCVDEGGEPGWRAYERDVTEGGGHEEAGGGVTALSFRDTLKGGAGHVERIARALGCLCDDPCGVLAVGGLHVLLLKKDGPRSPV